MAEIDLTPTEEMAANAARGLELRRKHGKGGTEIGVARARDISNRKNLSPETVRRMHAFFSRHEKNKAGGEDDAGYIAWLLWGGDSGQSWARRKVEQMDKGENQRSDTYKEIAQRLGGAAKMAAQKVARFRVGKDLSGGYSVVPIKADGSVETSVYEEIGFRHSFPTADAALAKAKQMQAKYGGTVTMEDKQVSSRPGAKAKFAADAREVGNEILRQLGGGRFMSMVGGKNAMYGMFGGKPGLQVSIGKGAEGGINRVIVTLDPATDTYRMEFWKIAKGGMSTQKVSEASMVYADDLQRVFTDRTRFYTSMSRPGAKAKMGNAEDVRSLLAQAEQMIWTAKRPEQKREVMELVKDAERMIDASMPSGFRMRLDRLKQRIASEFSRFGGKVKMAVAKDYDLAVTDSEYAALIAGDAVSKKIQGDSQYQITPEDRAIRERAKAAMQSAQARWDNWQKMWERATTDAERAAIEARATDAESKMRKYRVRTPKSRASRPGAKAKFAKRYDAKIVGNELVRSDGRRYRITGRKPSLPNAREMLGEVEWLMMVGENGSEYSVQRFDDGGYRVFGGGSGMRVQWDGLVRASRPGAKAKMGANEDRKRAAGYKWQVRYTKQLGKTDYLGGSPQVIEDTVYFATESNARDWANTMLGKGWFKGMGGSPEKVLTAKVLMFSRPGAKVANAIREGEKVSASDDAVSRKIRKLMDEGKPQKQAVAIALDLERRGEL